MVSVMVRIFTMLFIAFMTRVLTSKVLDNFAVPAEYNQ